MLLALTGAGMSREDAYAAVQRNAMRAWRGEADFRVLLGGDPEIAERLDAAALDSLFDLDRHFRHVDALFRRVFGDPPAVTAEDVLAFWFDEAGPKRWFAKDPAFDALAADRLGAASARAAAGGYAEWREDPRGCLALILLLDQIPRNVHRGGARAFAADALAREAAAHALARGFDRDPGFSDAWRQFFYMPYQHSEDMADQDRAVALAAERLADPAAAGYAERHREAIRRFGRFPGRNAALGRDTTAEEAAVLARGDFAF